MPILKLSRPLFFISFIMICLTLACNFNITDNPGPQISSTIESSRKHKTFISAYKIVGNKLNGREITSIFSERSYLLSEGLFGHFVIDCCQSQLVILFKTDSGILTLNDTPTNWQVIGFKTLHSNSIVKYYTNGLLRDSFNIQVMPFMGDTLNIQNVTLYKQ